jgi:hypothetical protein
MSTNYELYYNTCTCCGRSDILHIGKSAAGWKFLFRKHVGVAENVQQWRDLTAKGAIIDEYGKVISYEDFWALVESKQSETRFSVGDGYSRCSELIDGYNFASYEFS